MLRKLLPLLALLPTLSFFASCGGEAQGKLAKIRQEKVAYIGAVPFEPPLLYQQGAQLVGPDAELAQRVVSRIEEEQGLEPGSIKPVWLNRTYPTLIESVSGGELDFALGVLAITEERKEKVLFSKPYYTSEMVLIVNPAVNDIDQSKLADVTVGVRQSTGVETFVSENYPSTTTEPFKTLDDAVLALRRGEVDAVIDDHYMAAYSLATTPGAGHMEIIPEVLGSVECAVAVNKGQESFLELINGVIDSVADQYASWLQEHAQDQIEQVASRRTERLERARQAVEPRQIYIRVSKDAGFEFDIYRMANLRFVMRNQNTGRTYSTSRINFRGSVGSASTNVPPGAYVLSLPQFNFSTGVQISSADPSRVSISIRISSGGIEVRKS